MATGLLAFAAPALAQDIKPVEVNIGAGFTIPYSDSKHSFGTGGNFQFGATFNVTPTVGIQANYFYNRFGSKDFVATPCIPGVYPPAGGVCSTIPFSVNSSMHDGDFSVILSSPHKEAPVIPYGILGVGVYHNIVNLTTPSVGTGTVCDPWIYICYPTLVPIDVIIGERTATSFGMNFGGGVNVPVGYGAHFYAEVRYIHTWGPTITNPVDGTTIKANGNYWPFVFGFKFY
jgi:opacity protein-like surface antigen